MHDPSNPLTPQTLSRPSRISTPTNTTTKLQHKHQHYCYLHTPHLVQCNCLTLQLHSLFSLSPYTPPMHARDAYIYTILSKYIQCILPNPNTHWHLHPHIRAGLQFYTTVEKFTGHEKRAFLSCDWSKMQLLTGGCLH